MIIAVDLDDVLAEFHRAFIDFSNETYGTSFKKEQFHGPDINMTWNIPKPILIERVNTFADVHATQHLSPRMGAQEMILRLAVVHSLHVVTNRPIEIKDSTKQWLKNHFSGVFSGVHFCTKDDGRTTIRPKNQVCRDIGAPIILEDHIFNAERCAMDGIHVYLFDQPWNRHELPLMAGAIVRTSDWQDKVLETLL